VAEELARVLTASPRPARVGVSSSVGAQATRAR
jgi:hypothetical protein